MANTAPRTEPLMRISRFEEHGARLRDQQWDAQNESTEDDINDVEFMAKYDRRGLIHEIDALRAEAAALTPAALDVERLRVAMRIAYDEIAATDRLSLAKDEAALIATNYDEMTRDVLSAQPEVGADD